MDVSEYQNMNDNELLTSSKSLSVSILIPAYNEEQNIPYVLNMIPKTNNIREIILIDGNSLDNTVEKALSVNKNIKIITQKGKGKGDAVLCGVEEAQGNYFCILDADCSHRTNEIPDFIKHAEMGYDLVKGSRYMKGGSSKDDSFFRRLVIFTAQAFANTLWGTNYTDIGYGMLLISKEIFIDLKIESKGFQMEWELMVKAKKHNLKIIEIPCHEDIRRFGKSNLSYIRDGYKIAKVVFKYGFSSIFSNNVHESN